VGHIPDITANFLVEESGILAPAYGGQQEKIQP